MPGGSELPWAFPLAGHVSVRACPCPAWGGSAGRFSALGSSCQTWDGHKCRCRHLCHQGSSLTWQIRFAPLAVLKHFFDRNTSALFLLHTLGLTHTFAKLGIYESCS